MSPSMPSSMSRTPARAWLGSLLLVLLSPAASALSLHGNVTLADRTPVAGAMVTLADASGYAETVYSGEQGQWRLDTSAPLQGPLTLRVRAGAAYADSFREINGTAAPGAPLTIALERLTRVEDVSERLTASAHAASIRWANSGTRTDFISQCHFCHQIGNATTRRPRSEQEWQAVIKRMEGYGALITWKNEEEFARTLAAGFNGKPLANVQTLAMHPDLPKARLREWSFGGPLNYVHDIEQGSDGLIYGVDMSADRLWILDPRKNSIEEIPLPPNGLPLGGDFAGAVAPLGTFAAYHGPHSVVRGPDRKLYMTCSLSAEICIYDPQTRRFEFIDIGRDALYPHTLRFDAKGTLWFTLALSNQIGRMDIRSREITLIDLPSNGAWRWLSDAMLPTVLTVASWFGKEDMHVRLSHHQASGEGRQVLNLPYGIDINPRDGSIWYSKLYAGYIGRVDPVTLRVEEYKTPHTSPRRLRFAADGTLWIPSFDTGMLMKFDTATRTFTREYKLPTLARNEYETPYALAVHPRTGQLWIASNLSDRILRFDPATETFAAYPSPTRVTYMRDFIFLEDGQVCTSNANLPAAAIEGGRPRLMCLDPVAGAAAGTLAGATPGTMPRATLPAAPGVAR